MASWTRSAVGGRCHAPGGIFRVPMCEQGREVEPGSPLVMAGT